MSLGLSMISTTADAQLDTTAQLNDQLTFVEDNYYFRSLDSAMFWYEKIAHQARDQHRWFTLLETEIQMAWCALHHQRLDTLPPLLRQAEITARTRNVALDTLDSDYSLRANIPYTWGLYYTYTEDHIEAINAYREVLSTDEVFSDSSLVSDTYYSTSVSYRTLENYRQSISYQQLALAWLPKNYYGTWYWYHQGVITQALGKSYLDFGLYANDTTRLTRAKNLFVAALTLLSRYDDEERARHAIHTAYQYLTKWFVATEAYDSALYYLQKSVPFQRSEDPELFETYELWGNIYLEKHQIEEARIYFHKALDHLTEIYGNRHPKKAEAYNLLAATYSAEQQWSKAVASLQQALIQSTNNFIDTAVTSNPPISHLTPPNRFVLETLLQKANVLYQLNKRTPHDTASLLLALQTYRLANEVLDQMRQTFPSLEYKQFLSAKASSLYEQAIRASLRAHELGLTQKDFLAEAFYFSEKGKAATLLEAVRTSEARSFADIPPELLEQENELKRKLTYWENELYQAQDDSSRRVFRNRAFETREAYNSLVKRLEVAYPNYYRLKYDTQVTGLAQLQATLPQETTLLSFSYGDSVLYAFTVRREEVHYHTVALDSVFHRRLENVLQTISQYDYRQAGDPSAFQQFTKDAHQLYQTLVQPSLDAVTGSVEQLIIIPDGLLGYLPFNVLLTEPPSTTRVNYQQLPYLVKQLPVSYEYSATLLTTPSPRKRNVSYSYTGFAPSYSEAPLAESREVRTTLERTVVGLRTTALQSRRSRLRVGLV